MSRRLAAFAGGVLFVLLGAGVSLGAVKPEPRTAKAVRFAVSHRAADLPVIPEDPKSPHPAEWIRDNEQLPRSQGPYANVPGGDAALQGPSVPAGGIPGPALTFPGLAVTDNGFGLAPPDTNGDVGPNHYVQTANVVFRIWDKAGNPLVPAASFAALFAPIGGPCAANDGDPIVLYDPLADRWLISQFGLPNGLNPPFHQCIALSQTGDPTGAYFLYDFLMPDVLNDYPHFGVWPDGYYMSDNQFTPGGAAFAGAGLVAFDRAKMLIGDPAASYIYFDYGVVDPSAGGMLPSDMDGLVPPPPGTPNLFMEYRADDFGDPADAIRIYEFHADFATPGNSTLTVRPDLVVAAFDARQPGGRGDIEQPAPATAGDNLDSISDRLMYRLAYRTLSGGVQSFVLNWTVNVSGVNPTSSLLYQAGIRFTELRRDAGTGAVSVQNQVTYAPGSGDGALGRNIWMGSTAQDNQGNSAVGFSASSTTLVPSIVWAGRLAGDAVDTLAQGEATMFAGVASQDGSGNRWGDYSAMAVDPADDCTFWYTNQYQAVFGGFNWVTRIGNFKFPSCTAPPKGTLSGTVTRCANGLPLEGASINVEGGYFRASDVGGDYTMDLPPGTYNVSITLFGYTTAAGQITIQNGQTTDFDACLTGTAVLASAAATLVTESCGPANGKIDPGETVTMNFCVRNTGGADTVNLVGDLEEAGGVGDAPFPVEFGVVVAGGPDVCVDVTFTAAEDLVCGDAVTPTLELEDGPADLGTVVYGPFPTGDPIIGFSENVDGVVAPAIPAGWTTATSGGPLPAWVTSTASADTAPNAFFSSDPAGTAGVGYINEVVSPSIAIATDSAVLTFRNSYDLEATYDGGVLEISIGGGAFQDIIAAGGIFVAGGYNGTIDTDFFNPLAGRIAWTGNSGGFVTTSVTLPAAAAGQNIQLKWRCGVDESVPDVGWYVDTISVQTGFTCCTPIAKGLEVDAPNGLSAPSAALNGVFEPGETVAVEPSYFNGDSAVLSLTGTASNFTGPAGATYTLLDSTASYGSIGSNATAVCVDCYSVSVDNPAVRPSPHWDATMLETPSTGPAKTWTLHIGASFPDVPDVHQFYSFIETIFHNDVTGGCGGGNYCPGNPALRKQMAVFLLKSRYTAAYVPPPAVGLFGDVPQADPFAPWVEDLYNRGITGGCTTVPLNYCPDNAVLRQQMAVFLLKTLEGASYDPPDCATVFLDVPCPSTFADWIEELADRGITSGCGGGNYCPSAPNTRGQMAVFLTRTFGLVLYGP